MAIVTKTALTAAQQWLYGNGLAVIGNTGKLVANDVFCEKLFSSMCKSDPQIDDETTLTLTPAAHSMAEDAAVTLPSTGASISILQPARSASAVYEAKRR
ncbi:MAG: hypothetical protein P8L39_11185 [Halioglobus sp.]|nr:hypothetical protein [Halioglobus sp.]